MSTNEEIWEDIPGWIGYYQASNLGRIRSMRRSTIRPHSVSKGLYAQPYGGFVLSPKTGRGDYLYVNLWRNNKRHMRAVHRLVCAAFKGLPIANLVCNHIDHNRQNNTVENLEFITQKENLQHAKNAGRR